MRLLIVGPPGAGKGTQGAVLAERLAIPHISTGDIFRQHIREGTDLGRAAKALTEPGRYVPDELTNEMVRTRLGLKDASPGFLLDGYPRTTSQVTTLDDLLATQGTSLTGVIHLDVGEDMLVERLRSRAVGGGRPDDTEEVVRRRHEIYRTETAPLLDLYAERGVLVSVDGSGHPTEVGARILSSVLELRHPTP